MLFVGGVARCGRAQRPGHGPAFCIGELAKIALGFGQVARKMRSDSIGQRRTRRIQQWQQQVFGALWIASARMDLGQRVDHGQALRGGQVLVVQKAFAGVRQQLTNVHGLVVRRRITKHRDHEIDGGKLAFEFLLRAVAFGKRDIALDGGASRLPDGARQSGQQRRDQHRGNRQRPAMATQETSRAIGAARTPRRDRSVPACVSDIGQ